MRLFFVMLFCAGSLFGQSGVFNPAQYYQVRLRVPYVEPHETFVDTNGVLSAASNQHSYCDFNITAVDQTGVRGSWVTNGYWEYSDFSHWDGEEWIEDGSNYWVEVTNYYDAVLWEFDSRTTIDNETFDTNAVCYYTDSFGDWVQHSWTNRTNSFNGFEWVEGFVGWNDAITRTFYPSTLDSALATGMTNSVISSPPYPAGFDDSWPGYDYHGIYTYCKMMDGNWEFYNYSEDHTYAADTDFLKLGYSAPTPTNTYVLTNAVITNIYQGGSIRTVSGGDAYSIEVFPDMDHENSAYFKPWDMGISWRVKLWDGESYYSNPETTNPILLDVEVDFVQGVPLERGQL